MRWPAGGLQVLISSGLTGNPGGHAHEAIVGTIGQQTAHEDHRLGTEAYGITRLWPTCIDGLGDGVCDQLGAATGDYRWLR